MEEYKAALQGEHELRKYCDVMGPALLSLDVPTLVEALTSNLPEVDKNAILNNSDIGQYMVDTIHESLKRGWDGWVDDDFSILKPWGFELSEIKVPVLVFHGSEDAMAPFAHGQWIAKRLPEEYSRGHLIQGEGHFSLFVIRMV